jgi:phosphatidylglycerol---prolipoprotein diacylglyceryl transferase
MKTSWIAAGSLAAAAALIWLLFVPVFTGRIELNPIMRVGGFAVHYYGLALGAAILAGYFLARKQSWRFGISQDGVDKLGFWLIAACLVSARAYFVLFEMNYFLRHPLEIFQIWNGGLSIFGAILGGLAFILFYSRNKAFTAWQALDLVALVLPLGQAIGRLGNFFNYEAYGSPTNLPWRMYVPNEYRLGLEQYYHPTFLYEAIGNLLLFYLLWHLRGKTKPGDLALMYLLGYSALRFMIEPLRMDSVYLGGFRADLIVALAVFFAAGYVWLIRNKLSAGKT